MPSALYEALPYIYLIAGAGALFGVDAVFGRICGVLLIGIGFVVLRMRSQSRKRQEIRNLMLSNHG